MKEIVVISGKGGTGKTSVLASFAVLAKNPVLADCDVDAADLHLVLKPNIIERHDFISGHEAVVLQDICDSCGACLNLCRFDAIKELPQASGESLFEIDPHSCEGCGVCYAFCPLKAIDFPDRHCGEWMISDTRAGLMVHAKLGIAAENSGKLVSTVRQEARRLAEEKNHDLILIDGPPGTGCPVISSITGASMVLVVTEPTLSGEHDLKRILELVKHFNIPAYVCVNKWDISPDMTKQIEKLALLMGASVLGRIRYDKNVTKAQIEALTVVETNAPSAQDIKKIWETLQLQ
ncbi:MAG: ATP-binding protein [Alphaproteobacteria bacterium]|nr:ATP-binding protein [Alphaproteobacteria bacterium]